MLIAFLSNSGGRIIIPEATAVAPSETDDCVQFVDESGRVLVVFRREDIAVYTHDSDSANMLQLDGAARATTSESAAG